MVPTFENYVHHVFFDHAWVHQNQLDPPEVMVHHLVVLLIYFESFCLFWMILLSLPPFVAVAVAVAA
jgi:hypothetical protein